MSGPPFDVYGAEVLADNGSSGAPVHSSGLAEIDLPPLSSPLPLSPGIAHV